MTDLVVRRLLVDLAEPIEARWNGGDAFRSALFNALSQSFPVGEQYFMDSVRAGLKALPEQKRAAFAAEVQGFVGQEATHRRIHALFNGHLDTLGFDNALARRAARRIQKSAHMDVRIHVAATAATEHLTAMFADWMFRHPEALQGTEPRLQTLWMWHASEESEHRSTAFDLYAALGGAHAWRVGIFRAVLRLFLLDLAVGSVSIPLGEVWSALSGGQVSDQAWRSIVREVRLPGLQTIQEFMDRRFAPAVATCTTVSQRLHDLSERVSQASSLLATRVGIARERQNQSLLASMDRRAKLQLRLQQTVEGLSVAAIAY